MAYLNVYPKVVPVETQLIKISLPFSLLLHLISVACIGMNGLMQSGVSILSVLWGTVTGSDTQPYCLD